MTASMILWTLEFLEWVRQELSESWPTAKLRGSAPDINPEPYRIRFRAEGAQYWLVLSPDAVQNVRMEAVASLLESTDWISTLKATGWMSDGDIPGTSWGRAYGAQVSAGIQYRVVYTQLPQVLDGQIYAEALAEGTEIQFHIRIGAVQVYSIQYQIGHTWVLLQ